MKKQRIMELAIKLEEATIAGISVYFLVTIYSLGIPAGWWILLFFTPDISMLGYLAGPKTGAFTYNLFHHRAVGAACIAIGVIVDENVCITVGLLLFGHASFDRMLGYGLKFSEGFDATHLGSIGKKS